MSKYTRSYKINHYHDSGSLDDLDSRRKVETSLVEGLLSLSQKPKQQTHSSINLLTTIPLKEHTPCSSNQKSNMESSIESVICAKAPRGVHNNYNRKAGFAINRSKLSKIAFSTRAISGLVVILILLCAISQVYSLNCYHCSSAENPECDEAFTNRANFTNTDCESHTNMPAKVCRKIVQYIEDKKVVIRSCGYIDEHGNKDKQPVCHKRSGTFALMMESCNCYTDLCNSSASFVPNFNVFLISTIGFLALLRYSQVS